MKRGSDETPQHKSKTPRTLLREKSSSRSSLDREPVHVFCRLRPLHEEPESSCVKLLSSTTLTLSAESKAVRKEYNYIFKHIFTAYAGQREVFEYLGLPLLDDLVNGKNGLLFTYGVTGSGKTFTLAGEQSNPGIMPQCIYTLFNTIEDYQAQKFLIKSDRMNGFEVQSENDALEERFLDARSVTRKMQTLKKGNGDGRAFYVNDGTKIINFTESNRYAVFISYIEIYNNIVYDLLDESTGKVLQGKIIREDSQKNMYVNGVVEIEVKSASEAFELFYLGQKRKRMGHTALNAESSRSHSIFTIRVVQLQTAKNSQGQPIIPDRNVLKVGQLSLVDLAGSERCSRTQNTGMRLKEASSINNSLMSLRTCLEILRENQLTGSSRLVPYRDSRLTLLFKNYFEGEGQVRMIVCVNPSIQDYEENLHVLKFAEMTQDVKVPKAVAKYTPYGKTPKTVKCGRLVHTPATLKPKKPLSFSFKPKLPSIQLNSKDEQEILSVLNDLSKILSTRKQKGEAAKKECTQKEGLFRKRLNQMNQETVLSQSEIRSAKMLLKKQKQTTRNLETKVSHLETVRGNLDAKNKELQDEIATLQSTIEEKNLKINHNLLEREKTKQKLALQSAKMTHELDAKLRRQREHHQVAMQNQDAKLQKVKQILDETPATQFISETQPMHDYEPQQTPPHEGTYRRNINRASRHRRSRSADEVWLEHNAIKPVALGTIFQPSMKKKKSITKLNKAKDITNTNQTKYCLIAQQPAVDGELETKLYKGDIVPTCGGGAQVIFNDIERLRQESPTGSPAIINHK